MKYNNLKISLEEAENIALNLFKIQGTVSQLPGELDFNFRIKIEDHEGYVLKISRPHENENYLNYQQEILEYLEENAARVTTPKVIKDKSGNATSEFIDDFGHVRKVRLLSWISGRVWRSINPQLDDLRFSLGEQCGLLTLALKDFDHLEAHRSFEWDVSQSLWTKEYMHLFEVKEKEIISSFQKKFEAKQNSYNELRKAVVHNDANDNNIIVSNDLIKPVVKAVIDYGDAIYTQVINDLAIACVYAIMNHNDPLEAARPIVQGYHSTYPLEEQELEHLYNAIAMRLVISVTKSAISKIEEPDNKYLLISEKPAWEVLKKWYAINEDFAHYSFREACGYGAHPKDDEFKNWANQNIFSLSQLFPTINKDKVHKLDLGVSSKWIGHQVDFNDLDLFQFKIDKLQKSQTDKIIGGGYLEPRVLYAASSYDKIGNSGRESRSIHLGVDFWLPMNTPVHSLFSGKVEVAVNEVGDKTYGGLIILKHAFDELEFYTLYGHLSGESANSFKKGDSIDSGDCIGYLGESTENGNWTSHLHFQIMLSMLEYQNDFPGVAYPKQYDIWKSICPDPNLLFKTNGLGQKLQSSNKQLIEYRKRHLGKSLSLQYKKPIKMVRGSGQYLIDETGRKYLDTVNNVAHVGHEHPAVVKAGQEQMSLINTNSRYLHDNINELAQELLETLPAELSVLHFVNSGSEANELAIRMVKATTGQCDIIASEAGYHGNTNRCVDISSYKFDGKGGQGVPEYTHIIPLPDSFRGKYKGNFTGCKYAEEVEKQIKNIQVKGRGVGAFIIEPIISCGGQISLPQVFLHKAYEYIRFAGGLCISDEVQVGCGRLGKVFWGFQLYDVVPDIVTIGKPLGNGHPLAAVACTEEVATNFANGMEYFNTFGGNPVSCAIGTEVLRTVKRENLQENALTVGEFLKTQLMTLSQEFPIIGDVRGEGLFLGIELVDAELNPLAGQTDYLAGRMKDYSILMSTDGPDHNVLKIKPPMIFAKEDARELIFYLRKILAEDYMTSY